MKYFYVILFLMCASCKIKARHNTSIKSDSNVVYYINGKPAQGNVGKAKGKEFKKMINPIQ